MNIDVPFSTAGPHLDRSFLFAYDHLPFDPTARRCASATFRRKDTISFVVRHIFKRIDWQRDREFLETRDFSIQQAISTLKQICRTTNHLVLCPLLSMWINFNFGLIFIFFEFLELGKDKE